MQAPDHLTPLPANLEDSGILCRVPSQYVVQACRTLPDPACALEDAMSAEVDADWVGRVRLTFKKRRYSRPRGKTSYVAWLCCHAEAVSQR